MATVLIDDLRLNKTNQLILEEWVRTGDWDKVKKNLRVTDVEVRSAQRTAAVKVMKVMAARAR